MGLSHWVESDGAADFRYDLQKVLKTNDKKKLRNVIKKELKDGGNCYNTPGPINMALVMETEGVVFGMDGEERDVTPIVSNILIKKEFVILIDKLKELIKECCGDEWYDTPRRNGSSNAKWHRNNYKRLLKVVEKRLETLHS